MLPKLRNIYFNLVTVVVTAILVFIVMIASYNDELYYIYNNSGLASSNRGLASINRVLASASKGCQAGKSKKIVFLKTHKVTCVYYPLIFSLKRGYLLE